MLPEELEQVFGSVTQLYSRNLSDAFRRLPPQVCLATHAWDVALQLRYLRLRSRNASTLQLMRPRGAVRQ